ncbi:PAS domain-containing sensor histidine kinase [Alteromonas lipolytica]|uniref:Histidine kinase n=1 Tax=Alteromonas lipolytica TaxID=1856405 RepID=A0A1E8FC20_9ALTE|nr:PAS domain-containing sensor histidine kinase [Alteromonas lipolytica]OFI33472.1 hypothetical protein BFC17_04220 [Alteromonas lipolytica]GGF59396.1 two-component system sensor kinase [Alteromonas lipolytica]
MTANHNNKPPYDVLDEIPYQFLVEQSLVGIYLIQSDILKYCNAAFAGICGYTPEQVMGRKITEMVAPPSVNTVLSKVRERIEAGYGTSQRYLMQAKHADGYIVSLEVNGRAVMYQGEPAIAGVAIDATQRLQYEQELKASHHQLQQVARSAIKLREQHRQEIARDIHDVLGGLLTSIKMDATRIVEREPQSDIVEIAEDIIHLSQESINFARNKSEELYPSTLTLGLIPTIENLLQQQQLRSGIKCEFTLGELPPRLSSDREIMIFRIVQESLTNVIRHADASAVDVQLDYRNGQLFLTVDDDGVGLQAVPPRDGAFGLMYMRERAADYNGVVTLGSNDYGGTRVSLTLPLPIAADNFTQQEGL